MMRLACPQHNPPLPLRKWRRLGLDGSQALQPTTFEHLNGFFDSIYEGALETPPWHSALGLLRNTLNATHVTLILRPPTTASSGVMVNTDTVAHNATDAYQSHYFALDPFVNLPDGDIVTPEEVVGQRQWRDGPLYREYLRPLHLTHLIGADIHLDNDVECRFRVSRSSAAAPFSAQEKALCRFLLPHLKRSIRLHARLDRLEAERQLFAGAIDRIQLGVISIGRDGNILRINPEARHILDEADGIRLSGNLLCIDNNQDSRELQGLIHNALTHGNRAEPGPTAAMSVNRPSGRQSLGIIIRSVQNGAWSKNNQRPAAILFLRNPELELGGTQRSEQIVHRLFGLTRMEAALALALADGLSLDDAAEKLNITRNTARTYVRFIFHKTGVTRQSMLVRLLLNNVIGLV